MSQPADPNSPHPADPSEEMHYGMLGAEKSTSEEKLSKYTGVVDWNYLKPHYESDALLWVDPTVRITEVGMALINDDSVKVQTWLKNGDIIQPSEPHAAQWENSEEKFLACVVSPFVLIQPSPAEL